MLKNKLARAVAMTTALAAVVSVGLVSSPASALPPGSPANPGQTLSVASGTDATTFQLNLAAPNNVCPGDTASGGYRWQQYIVSAAVDAGTLTYNASGPLLPVGAPVGATAQPLYSTTGSPQVNKNTAISTGLITGTSTLNFATQAGANVLPNGAYKIGFACSLSGATASYWETAITISGAGAGTLSFSFGAAPAAPALGALTPGDGTLTGTFTAPAASPAATYSVTTVPVTASTTVTPGTPFILTGLTNGTSYAVTVTADNGVGGPVAGNTVNGTPVPGVIPAPSPFTATSGAGQVVLNWAPATVPPGATLVNHIVTVSPVVAGSPFTVAAGTNTLTVTAAPASYSFTIQATYSPGTYTGASATAVASSNNAQSLIQDITVTRPAGALVLTQRCGVYGSAAAYSDADFGTLAALPALPAEADPIAGVYTYGAVGSPNGGQPSLDAAGTTGDPEFPQYPYPLDSSGNVVANYPTHCGINLGVGKLITSGPKAGQYFTATGRIAQITVVNTQDVDNGWTLNGRMSDFTRTGGGGSFSGNLLGWNPEVTFDSAANLDGYDMVVTAGGVRNPVASASTTGLGDVSNETNTSLSQSLAKADALNVGSNTGSLGLAVLDGRLRLLIPLSANAGTYTGTLTFTTV